MAKTNLIKGIVCGLMLTAVVGTTAFAGTVSRSANLRSVKTYSDTYTGEIGAYNAYGTYNSSSKIAYANLKVQNVSGSIYKYYGEVSRWNSFLKEWTDSDIESQILAPGGNFTVSIVRDYAYDGFDYYNHAKGYYSPYTDSVVLDSYTYEVIQTN